MHAFSIGTEGRAEDIMHRLAAEFCGPEGDGGGLEIGLRNCGPYTFLNCRLPVTEGRNTALIRHSVASALSDVIVDGCCRTEWLRKIIRANYYYFSPDEQAGILSGAERHLRATEGDAQRRVQRKASILHRLRDYLDQANELVVEGFVTFRLQDYVTEMEDAVDRAVDDYLIEREQREFVRLLRYFVECQEPRADEVSVLLSANGSFQLRDGTGQALHSDLLEEFVVEMVDGSSVSYDDLLLSALVTVAPRRVILHGPVPAGWADTIETLRGVFTQRLEICAGCRLCPPVRTAALLPPEPRHH